MAYALFWRRPLATVDLVADQLSVKDVEWMEQVWRAANPLTLLFPDEVDTGGPRVVVASHVFLSHPGGGTSRASSLETSPCAFDVIGKSQDGYLTVLLPGWGKAWIQEAKAKIVSNTQLRPAIPQSSTYLLIQTPTTVASVLALLRLVGTNLKYLGVRDIYYPSSIGFFEQIVSACPNLEALELPGMARLQPLLDAFRARKCVKLQRLELTYVMLVDESEAIRVFDALANPRNAIATTLRQLHFDMRKTASRATFDAVLGMLTTNARLCEVDFMVYCNRALAEEFEPANVAMDVRRSIQTHHPSPRPEWAGLPVLLLSDFHHWHSTLPGRR